MKQYVVVLVPEKGIPCVSVTISYSDAICIVQEQRNHFEDPTEYAIREIESQTYEDCYWKQENMCLMSEYVIEDSVADYIPIHAYIYQVTCDHYNII